jgi:hypothetical protein
VNPIRTWILDFLSRGVSRSGHPCPNSQLRAVPLAPWEQASCRSADDVDDDGTLQRTRWRVLAFHSVLMLPLLGRVAGGHNVARAVSENWVPRGRDRQRGGVSAKLLAFAVPLPPSSIRRECQENTSVSAGERAPGLSFQPTVCM